MNYVFDEISDLLTLIKNRKFDFEGYFKSEKTKLKPEESEQKDSIANMLYFLSEIYLKVYERENRIENENQIQIYYNIWAYNTSKEVLLLSKDNSPLQEMARLEDFVIFYQ